MGYLTTSFNYKSI